MKIWILRALVAIGILSPIHKSYSAVADLTVDVPKTAYIEWIATAATAMSSVDGDGSYAFDPYVGGAVTQLTSPAAKNIFLGVMCNSLAGYDVTLNAGAGATATTGRMTIAGGTPIDFTGTLTKEAGTFTAGATAAPSLDLTGGSVSATSVFAAEADLPMAAASPNVWRLSLALPVISTVADGLIMSGTYTGQVTATIALK